MQDKELERLLQEKADNEKMKDFSLVWDEIKEEIQQPVKEKKIGWKKWFPMVLASAAIIICIALSPVIINSLTPPPEQVFFTEELNRQEVSVDEAFDGLATAKISHVDMSKYSFISTFLYYTKDMEVKGASIIFFSDDFYAEMNLYAKDVKLDLDVSTYEDIYKVNSTDARYKLKQASGGVYDYSVYAEHNNVKYVIEYTGISDNLIDFLNEFFG